MSVLTPGRNLVLIGMMGSGKSTVGRLCAERLGRPFADLDLQIEASTGMTVEAYFTHAGERAFRALESERIRWAAALRGQVIAAGGGAVFDPGNVTQLRSTGDLVLLDAEPEALAERIAAEEGRQAKRPLVAGLGDVAGHLAALRVERAAAYASAAGHVVDTTGRSPEAVSAEVLDWAADVPGLLTREELGP